MGALREKVGELPSGGTPTPTAGTPQDSAGNAQIAPCLSVLMPVYNEAATLREIVRLVLAQRPVQELVAVDDASTDGSWSVLQELAAANPRLSIHRHPFNQGKGAALRTAAQKATSPIVIVQDADLEYDPAEYHLVLKPILSGRADVVLTTRFAGFGAHRVLFFWHMVGNKLLTMLSNMFSNLNLTDMESCYKAFRRETIQSVRLEENRFGFEPEVVAKVSRLGLRIYEVPVSYYGRTYAEGKKIQWQDGVSALRCILKYNLFGGS